MTLKDCLDEICPHCGSGSEYVVKYVKEHDSDPQALYEEAIKLSDCYLGDLIGILLSSDYNIFVPWFKAFCKYVAANDKADSGFTAKDVLDYYKEGFNEVKDYVSYI